MEHRPHPDAFHHALLYLSANPSYLSLIEQAKVGKSNLFGDRLAAHTTTDGIRKNRYAGENYLYLFKNRAS
jgi:hypothetical protein